MISAIVCCLGIAASMFSIGVFVGIRIGEGRYDD